MYGLYSILQKMNETRYRNFLFENVSRREQGIEDTVFIPIFSNIIVIPLYKVLNN